MDSIGRSDHLALRNPNAEAILRAVEKRNPKAVSVPGRTPRTSKKHEFEPWDANHPMRLEFRRLLDPGILRNNDKKDAVKALRVLNDITENILQNPNDPKYHRLNINSERMRLYIMPRKGTVEYLQKMGFREQTEKQVTRLVFNPERMADLRTGAKCLDEVIKNQVQAIEDKERERRQAIANEKAAKTKVVNAILDDRRTVATRVEREKSAEERGVIGAEADESEPPVEEMSKLKIKTLSDYS